MKSKNIVYCADVIGWHEEKKAFVIVRRLGSVKGLALPGGKQDPGESLTQTAVREVQEETGLIFVPQFVLETRAEPDRDPRGHYVSTIFVGKVIGVPQNEKGKGEVLFMKPESFEEMKSEFVFGHANILGRCFDFF